MITCAGSKLQLLVDLIFALTMSPIRILSAANE